MTSLPETVAAIDLGSNSFHMVVARVLPGGELQVIDKVKDRVRLAAGLDKHGDLTPEAQERALASLSRFGQRVRDMPRGTVRAVGTNTLRKGRNALPFLVRAHKALGHPIEIISGREEARLIYLGVAHDFDAQGQRLVVDIGGGSTEIIVGLGFDPIALDSLYMGCVSWSMRFFPEGKITPRGMRAAMTAAGLQLEGVVHRYRTLGWSSAVGSSGTINAIERVLREAGIDPMGISRKGLKQLRRRVIEAGHADRLELPGLQETRRPVFAGGLAVLSAVFGALKIKRMSATGGALREGLLYELIGRRSGEDIRENAVARFGERLQADPQQARRVQHTALALFDQVAPAWGLHEEHRSLLGWAARLHEVGTFLTYSGYHKHSAYLIANADLPGFSRQAQGVLAALVLAHRGLLAPDRLALYYPGRLDRVMRQAVLLRLAVRLRRSRSPHSLPDITLTADGESLHMAFPPGWLDVHPLTRADLEEEVKALRAARLALTLS
jgi:exopolyphosphatase/guanosine-5'-triphosphate,3'-diphosphate pyrophosphatase